MNNYIYLVAVVLFIVFVINRLNIDQKVSDRSKQTTTTSANNSSSKSTSSKTTKPVKLDQPKYGAYLITLKGHMVRSRGEQLIADFLFTHQIPYLYEPKLVGLRPDFYIKEQKTIIEYWGMLGVHNEVGEKYLKSMQKKLEIYRTKQFKVISVYPQDISSGMYKSKISDYIPILVK